MSITSAAVSGVPREDTGVASALLNASQQIGGSLGLAVLTAVATARFDAVRPLNPTPATVASATTSSWAYAFVIGALLLFAAAIIAGWLLRPHREQPHPGELTATDEAVDRPVEQGVPVPQYAAAAEPGAAGPSPDFCIRAMARSGCHG